MYYILTVVLILFIGWPYLFKLMILSTGIVTEFSFTYCTPFYLKNVHIRIRKNLYFLKEYNFFVKEMHISK